MQRKRGGLVPSLPRATITIKISLALLALTTMMPLASAQSLSSVRYIPHITQGRGWSTEFHIFNLCSSSSQYSGSFRDSDGELREFYFSDELWTGFGVQDLKARAHHFWRLPNTEDVRQGYGEITDDGSGCVAVETFYVQHLSSGQTRRAVSPTQHLSSGVGISFINSDECDTGVAIIGNGESVSLEAVDWDGETLGQADLGNIFHTSFLLSERLPVVKNHQGTVQINGNVSALSLEFCNGNLAQSRWAHPVPGAQVVVVSFEAKRIGDGVLARHAVCL